MKALGRLHASVLLLALVNMAPALEVEKSWGLLAIALGSAGFSYGLAHRRRGRAVPRWAILSGVLCAVGYLLYEMFAPQEETTVHIVDLAHFLVLLCCCKFFELRSVRDAGVVAMISFLLLVTSAFVSASIWFAAALAVDLSFGMAWMMAYHARREANAVSARQAGRPGPAEPPAAAWREAAPGRGGGWGLFPLTCGCSVFIALTIGAVFVSTPRDWGIGLFGQIQRLVPTMTGFADVVQLSPEVLEDDTPVMRTRFTRNGRILSDAEVDPYLRGLAFHRYYDGSWRRFPTFAPKEYAIGAADVPTRLFDSAGEILSDNALRQDIWLEESANGIVFSSFPPLAFGSPDIRRLELDHLDWSLRSHGRGGKLRYTVYSPVELAPERAKALPMQPIASQAGGSKIPPRVRLLAERLASEAGDASNAADHERIARRIRDYLAEGDFEYTLSRKDRAAAAEPVLDFLFSNKRGHCTYFATAMTLMCQSLAVQARFVSGYHGGEYNEAGGFFQFRKSDAHAWVEVYLTDRGWVMFDPTPPTAGNRRATDPSLLARARALANYLQFQWSIAVVSFDNETREALATAARQWIAAILETAGKPRPVTASLKTLVWGPDYFSFAQRLLYWAVLLLWAAFVLIACRVLWILSVMVREWLIAWRPSRSELSRVGDARYYDRLLLLLARKGHQRPGFQTPREFARGLAISHAELAELPLLTEWYYEVQFGGRPLGRARSERIRRFLRALREDPGFGAG